MIFNDNDTGKQVQSKHTLLLLCKITKSYLQEVGSSYHPQLRDSLEAAGYEGQFLQKVMMMLVVTMQRDEDVGGDVVQELGTEEGGATYWRKQVQRSAFTV